MQKINLIEKSETLGSQHITLDVSDMEVVTPDQVEELAKQGYYFFTLKGLKGEIIYKTKEADGLVRDVETYVEENGFNPRMKLFNACDNLTWAKNIQTYFDYLIKDEEFVDKVEAMCAVELATPPKNGDKPFDLITLFEEAREYLKDLKASNGKTGSRPMVIYDFLAKKTTGLFDRNRKAYELWNGVSVNHPKFPYWTSKLRWKKN